MNTSRPSIIGASSDITRDSKPPSVTPLGYSYETAKLGSQLRAWARTAVPPTPLLIPLFRNEVPDTFSLGVPDPFTVCAYGPRTSLVRVVARPPRRTAVKTYVPTLRCVRSRHLCRLFRVMLILPLPQLVRCSRTPCRRAKVLLTRPRPHIPPRGLLEVSARRGCR